MTTLSPDLLALFSGLRWNSPPRLLDRFRYRSDNHRNAAARLILSLYGDRVCFQDQTSADGKYRPGRNNLPERAIVSWECAMSSAKYDRWRTAAERADCLEALRLFEEHCGDYNGCAGCKDAALQFILIAERWAAPESFLQR